MTDDILADLRDFGWTVAIHNDYRDPAPDLTGGYNRTFWLLTHPNGFWVKGEGSTDDEALQQCRDQIRRRYPAGGPPQPSSVHHSGRILELLFDTEEQQAAFWRWVSRAERYEVKTREERHADDT